MARAENGTVVDRIVERVFYPNWNGITPGPLAGRAMLAEREQSSKQAKKNLFSFGVAGLPNPTVSPVRPYHHKTSDVSALGPNEGRGFGLTTREQQFLSAVGVATLVCISSLMLRGKK